MGFFAVPTKKGLLFLLLAAMAVGVAFMNSGLVTALTAAGFAALCVPAYIMAHFCLAGITLKRTFPKDGQIGKLIYSEIVLHNVLPLFRHSCTVTEELPFAEKKIFTVPALRPGEIFTLSCPRMAEKRGEYTVDRIVLSSGDPLGLFRKKKVFRNPCTVQIQPQSVPLSSLAGTTGRGGLTDSEGRNLGRAGQGKDFFGVRPYRIGDEVRHIHWKSTAAKGTLMVKEFEASAVDQIVILLDTENKKVSREPADNNFEFLISCAASITDYLSRKYCHLSFIAADGDGHFHHFGGDAASVRNRIFSALTLLQGGKISLAESLAASAEHIKPSSIVFLLTMSLEKIPDYITIVQEKDCFCHWIWAPAENFPPAEEDKPRILYPEKVESMLAGLPVKPLTANFTTKADELLEGGNTYEKL